MIAVTGANGFIGAHLLRGLSQSGVEAIGVARSGARRGDFRIPADWSEASLREAFAGATAVVHAASVVHRPGAEAAEYERFNREGTRAVVAAARAAGVRHLVYLSTIKVYGEGRLDNADEDTAPHPEDSYSTTKLAAEQIVLSASESGGPLGTVLRLAPVYGRGDKGNVRRVLSAIARKRFLLPGDGSARKSLVHISTVVEVTREILRQRKGGIFIVSDREAPTMRQLADAAAAALGMNSPIAVPAWILEVVALPVEIAAMLLRRQAPVSRALIRKSLLPTICSPGKVERALGTPCHVELTTAVADEVSWMRESGLL